MNTETETRALDLDQLEQVVGGGGLNGHSTGALRNVSGDNTWAGSIGSTGALVSLGGVNTASDVTLKRGIIAI